MKKTQTNISRSGAKWLPGAMAVASTAASSHAATVQITFTNSFVSHSDSASNLVTDIGGDGLSDIRGFGANSDSVDSSISFYYANKVAYAYMTLISNADRIAYARGQFRRTSSRTTSGSVLSSSDPSQYGRVAGINGDPSRQGFYFMQTEIAGLGSRAGWLEVLATGNSGGGGEPGARIDVLRFVFDEANFDAPAEPIVGGPAFAEFTAVPEPSSFALLTLGAAGLLARRRRKQAA